jgi:hypothetical protein
LSGSHRSTRACRETVSTDARSPVEFTLQRARIPVGYGPHFPTRSPSWLRRQLLDLTWPEYLRPVVAGEPGPCGHQAVFSGERRVPPRPRAMLYYPPRHWPARALCDTGQQRASVCRFGWQWKEQTDGRGFVEHVVGGGGGSKLYAAVREQWFVCPGSLLVLLGRRTGWAYRYIHTRCYISCQSSAATAYMIGGRKASINLFLPTLLIPDQVGPVANR